MWLYRVSYLYNGVFGVVITLIVGYIASILIDKALGRKIPNRDPDLFIPPLAKKLRSKPNEGTKMTSLACDKNLSDNNDASVKKTDC